MQKDIILSRINNLIDPGSLEILKKLKASSNLSNNLLITGETGTGKDLLVNYLSLLSNKSKFLELHCGNTPEDLIESDWLGYKQGAFSGATEDRDGKFVQANDGILYFNQIDLLSNRIQRILLRLIERKKFYPIGSNIEKRINSRLVFSSNSDILEKINKNIFRNDLYYRISSLVIEILPLRKRKKDLVALFKFFSAQYKIQISLTQKGWKTLENYLWPGNIREMENFISNQSIMKNQIDDSDLFNLYSNSKSFLNYNQHHELSIKELEKKYIQYLLSKYKNKTELAGILQISRKSLYNKLKEIYEKN